MNCEASKIDTLRWVWKKDEGKWSKLKKKTFEYVSNPLKAINSGKKYHKTKIEKIVYRI